MVSVCPSMARILHARATFVRTSMLVSLFPAVTGFYLLCLSSPGPVWPGGGILPRCADVHVRVVSTHITPLLQKRLQAHGLCAGSALWGSAGGVIPRCWLSPQRFGRQPGALGHRAQLGPGDLGFDLEIGPGKGRKATIRASNHTLPTYNFGIADQALRH